MLKRISDANDLIVKYNDYSEIDMKTLSDISTAYSNEEKSYLHDSIKSECEGAFETKTLSIDEKDGKIRLIGHHIIKVPQKSKDGNPLNKKFAIIFFYTGENI